MSGYTYTPNVTGRPPIEGVCFGCQNDGGGKMWTVVAHTQHGAIGGKANRSGHCWFSLNGREHRTNDFSWLTAPEGRIVPVRNRGIGPPRRAVVLGRQGYDAAVHYAAVANSDFGLIPGRANGNTCWFGHGGKEYVTPDFLWLAVFV
ncbi:uncharacterized protein LOC124254522 [Haliotis rubra]|uniref:uncharacterized protein LOC124254522 n=1 Tax=Haliotis rubra TaxID=36100 RepID=UPI001EE6010C|nr:uncharacterized protein LOC124254522 [Haliotis rubra]